jgi:hypothetical protein
MSLHAARRRAECHEQRSHECERGTQECVRHNDFDILLGFASGESES